MVASSMDAREITEGLGGRWRGTRGDARCPAHNDRTPSLSIADGTTGSPVIKCHTGCDSLDVIDALRSRGLWPERTGTSSSSRITTALVASTPTR
jgi:hypothetical protein